MNLFIIQEEINGIVETPLVFTDEKQADNYYLRLVKENAETDEIKTLEDARAWLDENWENGWDIHYWAVEPERGQL